MAVDIHIYTGMKWVASRAARNKWHNSSKISDRSDAAASTHPSQRHVTCYAIGMAVVFLLPIVFLVAIGLLALRGLIVG